MCASRVRGKDEIERKQKFCPFLGSVRADQDPSPGQGLDEHYSRKPEVQAELAVANKDLHFPQTPVSCGVPVYGSPQCVILVSWLC